MGEPSTQIYFTAYNSNERSKVRTAGLLFCKPLSFALLIFQEYEWIMLQWPTGCRSLTLQGKILCRKQALDVNHGFSVLPAASLGYKVSRFWKSMTLALQLLFS